MGSKQAFESFSELSKSIEEAANTWQIPGISSWTNHLQRINEVCAEHQLMKEALERIKALSDYETASYAIEVSNDTLKQITL